ncbi:MULTISPECIES: hypothetical protein [Sulfurimonas]|uniref:hypothetical protein n=1 Tax=Sulfurimonas TaxID=202746 RepID=UPI001263D59C|nr:hypothetical protein [Sulfurimonas indica]
MKKLISISILVSSLLFGAETYTQFLNTAVEDAYDIHNYSKEKMEQMAQSDNKLQAYSKKLESYEAKISSFLESQTKESFESKGDAQKALNKLEELSLQSVVLAKTVTYLASHQADNANESYNNTIQTTSKTILRLSDDIGVMADRILLMAKEIGIMADRIVETQEIQSKNLIATQKLAQYAMTLTDAQATATRDNVHNNMNAGMSNMNMNINQMQSQQASQATIPMH